MEMLEKFCISFQYKFHIECRRQSDELSGKDAMMKNRDNRTDMFLEKLKEDSAEYRNLETGGWGMEEKKAAIRSLMNIRMPGRETQELLQIQDAYLKEELAAKGIVTLSGIPTVDMQYGNRAPFAGKISLWQGDITRLKAGEIVNAANSQMLGCFVPCHKCIDNAIHSAAGMQLRAECGHIMEEKKMRYGRQYEEPVGRAVLTKAYNLPCEYVIHTVGPVVYGGLTDSHRRALRSCYENVLKCCVEHDIRSVAFCCISTGEFHFPNEEAARIAVQAVTDFLEAQGEALERVVFNVFKNCDLEIYRELLVSADA